MFILKWAFASLIILLSCLSFVYAEISDNELLSESISVLGRLNGDVDQLFDTDEDYQVVTGTTKITNETSPFKKLGITKNDIVKSYNGKPLLNAKETMRLYKEFKKGKVKTITVLRGGQLKVIKVK